MEKARTADARLRTLTNRSGLLPDSILGVQVACIKVVARYGTDLWNDPEEVSRRDNLQLLLNLQAGSVLGALPTTPRGALIRESGLTTAPVSLDSRQQRFAAWPANPCSSERKEMHEDSSSGKLLCRVVQIQDVYGRKTIRMRWAPPHD